MSGFGLCSSTVDLGFHSPQLGRRVSTPGKLERGNTGSDQGRKVCWQAPVLKNTNIYMG